MAQVTPIGVDKDEPGLLRVTEVAQRLEVDERTIYRWIAKGQFPHVRLGPFGNVTRIPTQELARYLAERTVAAGS